MREEVLWPLHEAYLSLSSLFFSLAGSKIFQGLTHFEESMESESLQTMPPAKHLPWIILCCIYIFITLI
jgi:hypothetical protein